MDKKITLNGIVWGNLWGGGVGGFGARTVTADTLDKAIEKAENMLKDGSLDSGMGFESLNGATLTAKIETIKEIDGKKFVHTEYEDVAIGNVTEQQMDRYLEM